MFSKTGWSKCDILKAGWPSGLRRQTQEILLWDFWYTKVCVDSNPSPVKICVQKGNILLDAVSNPLLSNFASKKPTFWSKQYFWKSNQEQDEADFTLQEGVIEDRMKQVRYTKGRMTERSKTPDSRNYPLRFLLHECVRGFESHSCQILRSNRQHFNRSSIESHSRQILRSKSQHFGRSSVSESQIKSKTKHISHYKKVLSKTGWSKCDILKAGWPSGLRRQTQEILLWDFWYINVCVGSNPSPVKFCVQKGNILLEAVSNPTPVKFCIQKANILVEAVFLKVKSRARRSTFHITRRCYRIQDEASAINSRQDGQAF